MFKLMTFFLFFEVLLGSLKQEKMKNILSDHSFSSVQATWSDLGGVTE